MPVVPVAYSRKFSGLFGGVLNYPHQIPVKGLGTDAALDFLRERLAQRETLKADIAEGHKVVGPALAAYDEVLRDLFSQVAKGA